MGRDAIKAEERKRGDGENYGGERRSGGEEALSLSSVCSRKMKDGRWRKRREGRQNHHAKGRIGEACG